MDFSSIFLKNTINLIEFSHQYINLKLLNIDDRLFYLLNFVLTINFKSYCKSFWRKGLEVTVSPTITLNGKYSGNYNLAIITRAFNFKYKKSPILNKMRL